MTLLESLILGLVQGFTEYLPISSSGHLAIVASLFDIDPESSLEFTVLVHVATVLSTIVILWKEVAWIIRDLFKKGPQNLQNGLNKGSRYAINILVSMIPIGFVGLFLKESVQRCFSSELTIVGIMLIVTASLLIFTHFTKPRQKENLSVWHAFFIGIAQAFAVLPGLSRSGSTIATGLLLGNKKENLAQFSFLMVIPPILGEALLNTIEALRSTSTDVTNTSTTVLAVGFIAAFLSGCAACKWMISIVRKGKLVYFGIYCAIAGILTLLLL